MTMTGNVPMDMVFMAVADKKECQIFVQGYTHDNATVLDMKKYVHCIDILHPQTISEHQYLLLGGLGVLIIIATVMLFVRLIKKEK